LGGGPSKIRRDFEGAGGKVINRRRF